jgi:putative phosphoribosyl transferase
MAGRLASNFPSTLSGYKARLQFRWQAFARVLAEAGIGTLLFDLLTMTEDTDYATRFDIPLLSSRLIGATEWITRQDAVAGLPLGYFGASTGAAAALVAAAELGPRVSAVVSRGG